MTQSKGEIRIYVACLAAYNNGILYGAWIDATQDEDVIRDKIAAMLKASPVSGAEEYAIHDYEGFEGVSVSEYEGIESVCETAAFLAEHGTLGGKLVDELGDLEDARLALEENYAGEYRSLADFAQELTEQSIEIPKILKFYIDYERMARDLEINDVMTVETGFEQVHVFWSR